jgi:hypothetical protein
MERQDVMPPPAAAGSVERLPSRLWGEYWEKFPNGDAPMSEMRGAKIENHAYCAVCGEWDNETKFSVLDRSKLSSDVLRMLTNSNDICRECVGRCTSCHADVTRLQLLRHDKQCAPCVLLWKKKSAKRPAVKPTATPFKKAAKK